ncbi:MAG: DUF1574 domain-containing protein [Cyanobacteria bacterium J06638_28]
MTATPSTRRSEKNAAVRPLDEWMAQHLAPAAQVQMRLRGNILHVLCETPNTLHKAGAIARLVEGLLQDTAEVNRIHQAYPQVYQLYLYNRRQGQAKPDWAAPIYLNRLERHQSQLQAQSAESLRIATAHVVKPSPESDPQQTASWYQDENTTALVVSQMSLAKRGDPNAIAWYLSEVLSTLDVGVWVSVRAVPGKAKAMSAASSDTRQQEVTAPSDSSTATRLWILCEAAYSPDPLLIAEPVAERLRQLSLTCFKDAVIIIQVQGETTPDWSLRIDLTPPDAMLREWARWGDEGAISRLVSQTLQPLKLKATVERKDASLHFIVRCSDQASAAVPEAAAVINSVAPLLEQLAPQGIHRAMIYGQGPQATSPAWVRCLNLPAQEHPDLIAPPRELAQQGDIPALTYLLTRLLNPDIDAQLATGGIRLQVKQRDTLLHVMADAPVCPTRRQVVAPILDFLKALQLNAVQGLRIYGRRSGQLRPTWSHGSDFQERPRLVPKAEPEFAASDTYVRDLLTAPQEDPLRTDLTPHALNTAVAKWRQRLVDTVRRRLVRTQLFVHQSELPRTPPPMPTSDRRDALRISVVWGLVGLLLTLQGDWLLGQILNPQPTVPTAGATATPETAPPEANPSLTGDLAELPWGQSETQTADAEFSDEGFTQNAVTANLPPMGENSQPASERPLISTTDLLSASPYPSFRSQQLDEKLALYHQRLATSGPPDILIIGSSRALRGVDPAALKRELTALGFGELDIFNFGVNGSTAQVVDLTLRRILTEEQLPSLIVWADGARAFNSGRVDVTYNAITTSEGYLDLGERQVDWLDEAGDDSATDAEADTSAQASVSESLQDSYQVLDETLSDQLGQWSAIHGDRDQLKAIVRDQVLAPIVSPIASLGNVAEESQNTSDMPIPEDSRIDFDGFLALDMRFNPATYYQLYARVSGLYDSDYKAFELEGTQSQTFQRLLQHTQALDIPVVFVNTPLTDEYLDDYRMDAEREFQRLMLQLSATEDQFIFRDLGQLWPRQYNYFSDPSHLNRYGAAQVAARLAQDIMIPWPREVAPAPTTNSEAQP